MLIVIDNYDSFTYNLVQYLGELGCDLEVYRNDQISLDQIQAKDPTAVVISPGPGRPEDAGISLDLIATLGADLPILGVCLGHQCIGQAFSGQIVRAPLLMHGKTSPIHHQQQGVFQGLSDPFAATRYHSLIIDWQTCPAELEITAWTEVIPEVSTKSTVEVGIDQTQTSVQNQVQIIMGVQHRYYPHIQGVQFHPESILTDQGKQLLHNFVQIADQFQATRMQSGYTRQPIVQPIVTSGIPA